MAAKGARFLKWVWSKWQTGADIDGGDIQDLLVEEGLLKRVPYDPDVHGTDFEASEFMDEGDDYFVPTEIGKTLLDAARMKVVP